MYKILGSILITAITTIGINNYVPLKYFDMLPGLERQNFGSTITTIQGTDTLSNSRTVINTNFSNLNTDKLEASSLYGSTTLPYITTLANLSTVGTIASGVWNGTAITVPFGGTGSTTLGANGVLLGNGASAIRSIACANSAFLTWTAGQPACGSATVDQSVAYTWTGLHTFSNGALIASTTIGTLTASSSIIITGQFAQPAASSTLLSRDTAGNDYWLEGMTQIASTTVSVAANSIDISNIPQRNHLIVLLEFPSQSGNSAPVMFFNNDTGTNYNQVFERRDSTPASSTLASTTATVISLTAKGEAESTGGMFRVEIMNPATARKSYFFKGYIRNTDPIETDGTGTWNNTSGQINQITTRLSGGATFPAGSRLIIYGSSR